MSRRRTARNRRRIIIALAGGVVLLVILSFAGLIFRGVGHLREARAVAETFLDRIAAHQTAAAYELTDPALRAANSREQFQQLVDQMVEQSPVLTRPTSRKLMAWKYDEGPKATRALLRYAVGPSKKPTPAQLIMIKRAGQWRVLAFDIGEP